MRRFIAAQSRAPARRRLRGALRLERRVAGASSGKPCGSSAASTPRTDYTTAVLRDATRMPGARWFEGATLNFAANLLRPRAHGHRDRVRERARRAQSSSTWHELRAQVASVAARLARARRRQRRSRRGVHREPPEAVVAMLATASVGAVWSSCSPDFGVDAVLDRFGQIEPKVLFATDGYFYNGKSIDSLPLVRAIAARLPELRAVVVVPYRDARAGLARAAERACRSRELLAQPRELDVRARAVRRIRSTFSIRRARPACRSASCTASAARLLQHRKEHVLHTDIRPATSCSTSRRRAG